MRGSLKLFTMFGIPVHLHWSFGLIFLYALYIGYANNMDIIGTIGVMIFFVALFACVLLHEYGHSLTARRYGVHTQDIILTPIGGIARLERMPEKPLQEFLVAIAGPMVNVVIALLLLLLGKIIYQGDSWYVFTWFIEQHIGPASADAGEVIEDGGLADSWFLYFFTLLLVTNIGLVVFNLIPAFPMDGGRIFRSLLAMRLGRVRATRTAAIVGQVIAVLFVGYGIFAGPVTLTLIGVFVFSMARSENSMVQLEDLLRRKTARDVVRTHFTRISSHDWMQTPIGMHKQGPERNFLVFDLVDNLVGKLTEQRITAASRKRDLSASVAQYMEHQVPAISPDEPLSSVYYLLVQANAGIICVVEDDQLLGVVEEADLQAVLRNNANRIWRPSKQVS